MATDGPAPVVIDTGDIQRPRQGLADALRSIGSATVSSELYKLGVRNPHIVGPAARTPGTSVAGPALTLQCMPLREDLYQFDEYADPEQQLHRHVLYHAQPGDMVVVDARGSMTSGIFGEMMVTYFKGRGGAGIVVDGCIRDSAAAVKVGVGIWTRGVTPNFHVQTDIFPYAVNVPVACGGTMVVPGDIVVADDDGAVVVPIALAEKIIEVAGEHAEWEKFSRQRLAEGGDLRVYYPLSAQGREEYEAWLAQGGADRSAP